MNQPPELLPVVERAKKAGIPLAISTPEATSAGATSVDTFLTLEMPNGRNSRSVELDAGEVIELAKTKFEAYTFLGDYDAIVNRDTGQISARVVPSESSIVPVMATSRRLMRIPGAVVSEVDVPSEGSFRRAIVQNWKISVSSELHSLELGTLSGDLTVMTQARLRNGISLTIEGQPYAGHDAALQLLESLSGSFFFDLDLRYGVMLSLSVRRDRTHAAPVPGRKSTEEPSFPKMSYPAEPLSLYTYGRSAHRLPLLAFLAYYQTLEYFFPAFSRSDAVNRVRRKLKDPRFDVMSDLNINELITASVGDSTGGRGERQQLRSTVRACTEVSELVAFLEDQAEFKETLCGKKRHIRGVEQLHMQGTTDLRDQVADRLYGIRCRVVHTKQEGDQSGVELLLPTSNEARSLSADIALAQYLARQALVVSASPMRI